MKLKAQLWDKVQYGFKKYYDGMMHIALSFDGLIDIDAIKLVADHMAERIPILKSTFVYDCIKPYWRINSKTKGSQAVEIINAIENQTFNKTLECFKEPISKKSKLQFKIFIVNDSKQSSLGFLINHMCFDGADFIYFVEKFAECYNKYMEGKNINTVFIKDGDRSFDRIYDDMDDKSKKKAKKLFENISKNNNKCIFPFPSKQNSDDSVKITVKRIPKDVMQQIRFCAKKCGATLNDAILASYYCALGKIKEFKHNDKEVMIVSMMNLRKHINDMDSIGLTNMTGFMPCKITIKDIDFIDILQKVSVQTKEAKQDIFSGLYGIPSLNLGFKVVPFSLAIWAMHIGYSNPLLGLSNIGTLDVDKIKFKDLNTVDGIITGASKYKPYFQVTFNYFDKEGRLCVAQKGNDQDKKIISDFLDSMIFEFENFIKKVG